MERLICLGIGYVLGLFQTSYIYGKIHNTDIREHGSGNAGTTNALRTFGVKAGLLTFLGDFAKAILAALLVSLIFKNLGYSYVRVLEMYAGLGAVLGHVFPFYLHFKGGKGVASTAGLMIIIDTKITLLMMLTFIIISLTTKYVSLASLTATILLTIVVTIAGFNGYLDVSNEYLYEIIAITVILMLIIIFKHRGNIKKLLNGTENKLNLSKHSQGE
ncbi:acyl-phosphate glycerol-3-phosphate acyltransferase [Acetitomaculum ruminis DSM 5522]|uniref:Glycerol-3-phosphate acyltransferase n=1 Tax=Acetitomaculum ruminis DSM 5522 TaxID=1120918 RepID=A0A1I0VNK5_9FIRM|nr:glycerol-3-phosphate 1-O-acyltransferase PlsY [Acetitomaculum ruminis]SFA77818.1 acyl-phosphate glycerol-3-phosphate acyltransferase [Acetitomaculum ruminis DSM 5522]